MDLGINSRYLIRLKGACVISYHLGEDLFKLVRLKMGINTHLPKAFLKDTPFPSL